MRNRLAFISYWREDEGASARILKNLLDDHFGSELIFMDVDNIRIGNKLTDTIEEHL